jgi:hypothetical protein
LLQKDKIGYIYALVDPVTDMVRYIGQSIRPNERLASHIWYAKNKRRRWNEYWMFSVIKKGYIPIMEILHECKIDDLNFWEEHYIFLYKSWGFRLTNLSLFPSKSGVSYNKKPNVSASLKRKYREDNAYKEMRDKARVKAFDNPEVRKKQIENSLKVIMTRECLNRRAASIRKNYYRLFAGFKNGFYIGEWWNKSSCGLDLGLNPSSINRCLLGIRNGLYEYTFVYVDSPKQERVYHGIPVFDEFGNITYSVYHQNENKL